MIANIDTSLAGNAIVSPATSTSNSSGLIPGVTPEFLERNKSLWAELGYISLPARIRAGIHGDDLAAMQLLVDDWAAARVVNSTSITIAAGRSQRFRKERGVQRLLKQLDTEVEINEEHILNGYKLRREQLKIPETREIARIVISTATGTFGEKEFAKIQEIRERILNGEDFGDVADECSDDRHLQRGYLGIIRKDGKAGVHGGGLDAQFVQEAFKLHPGEVSEPVRLSDGWQLLYCTGEADERYPTYKEAKPGITEYLVQELYWIKIERCLRLAGMTPGLRLEPKHEWMIPALYEFLRRQPIEINNHHYNATEILDGLWKYYQPTEEDEDQVRISWEKEQVRKAYLAEMVLETYELPEHVEILSIPRTAVKRAGVFFIVDTELDPESASTPGQAADEESLTIQDYVEGIEYARNLAVEKGRRLIDYAKHFKWKLVKVSDLDSSHQTEVYRMLDGMEVGETSQAKAIGRYVVIASRTPDIEMEEPPSESQQAFDHRKTLLHYIYDHSINTQ